MGHWSGSERLDDGKSHGTLTFDPLRSFTGILDPPLTDRGICEARDIGARLAALDLPPIDHTFTSPLQRATSSLSHILVAYSAASKRSRPSPPTTVTPELTERNYGELNGRDKSEVAEQYGAEQVQLWRRSYRGVPPGGESLEMTVDRAWVYYRREILPRLKRGECVLIVSHGNTLRGLCMKLDGLSEDEVRQLQLGTGALRVYRVDEEGHIIDSERFAENGLEGGPQ